MSVYDFFPFRPILFVVHFVVSSPFSQSCYSFAFGVVVFAACLNTTRPTHERDQNGKKLITIFKVVKILLAGGVQRPSGDFF